MRTISSEATSVGSARGKPSCRREEEQFDVACSAKYRESSVEDKPEIRWAHFSG